MGWSDSLQRSLLTATILWFHSSKILNLFLSVITFFLLLNKYQIIKASVAYTASRSLQTELQLLLNQHLIVFKTSFKNMKASGKKKKKKKPNKWKRWIGFMCKACEALRCKKKWSGKEFKSIKWKEQAMKLKCFSDDTPGISNPEDKHFIARKDNWRFNSQRSMKNYIWIPHDRTILNSTVPILLSCQNPWNLLQILELHCCWNVNGTD